MKNATISFLGLILLIGGFSISQETAAQTSSVETARLLLNDSLATPSAERQRLGRALQATHIVKISSGKDTVDNEKVLKLMSKFYEDQFRNSRDPMLPYFMLLSRNSDLALGIGGQLVGRAWYDWNGSVEDESFAPYLIPIPKNPSQMRSLNGTVGASSLFLTVIGKHSKIGTYKAYIQAKFAGGSSNYFKLKKAYFIIRDWTLGYTKSTYSDPDAEPYVIDDGGASGINSKTNILVRWSHKFRNSHWNMAASLELPGSASGTDDIYTGKVDDYLPDVAMMGQYSWNGGQSHVRLAGILRGLSYRDLVAQKNHTDLGWGLQLSSALQFGSPLSVYGIVSYGEGTGSYNADLSMGNYDLVPDLKNDGKMYVPGVFSYTLGVQYYFLPNLFSTLSFSQSRYYSKNGAPDDFYKYGIFGAANINWNITDRIQVGAEYLIGERRNMDGAHRCSDRVNLFFQFNF